MRRWPNDLICLQEAVRYGWMSEGVCIRALFFFYFVSLFVLSKGVVLSLLVLFSFSFSFLKLPHPKPNSSSEYDIRKFLKNITYSVVIANEYFI